jgi:hypothetical protein
MPLNFVITYSFSLYVINLSNELLIAKVAILSSNTPYCYEIKEIENNLHVRICIRLYRLFDKKRLNP